MNILPKKRNDSWVKLYELKKNAFFVMKKADNNNVMKLKYFFATCILMTNMSLFASNATTPPDSTATLIQRTAAMVSLEEGKTLFFEGKTKDALIKFREAAQKDNLNWRAPFWIARCQYELDNFGLALKYGSEAVLLDENEIDKYVYDLMGDSYFRLNQLDSAIINYEMAISKMSKMRANELLLPLKVENCKFAKSQEESGQKSERMLSKGNVNSGYDDYSPLITDGGKTMYFTSRRSDNKGGGLNPTDQKFFSDIYRATWDSELGEWTDITNDLGKMNSTGFESLSYISEDGAYALITLNTSMAPEEKIETQSSDICELKKNANGEWLNPKQIKQKGILTSFYDGNATVTGDGMTMYFISERNAEKSMSDIYVSEKKGKKWGPAKPLPMTVNSKGRETTPYITPDGRYLFFSSNGRSNSMGDYDVFVSEKSETGWSEPINLGIRVNSVNDDTHFQYYPELGKAYLSSFNILGQKASRDIFEIDFDINDYLKK